jgi:hypothetical protein
MLRYAQLSPCGKYRYLLERTWKTPQPYATFVMLNPSTADGTVDDPTIRKCIGFSHHWGLGGFYVVNLFAYRSTDPLGLLSAGDPVGPENDATIAKYLKQSAFLVFAWGAAKTPAVRALMRERVMQLYTQHELPARIWCLGRTADGYPFHPLMRPYAADPIRYE